MNPFIAERGLLPLSFFFWPPQFMHTNLWLVIFLITFAVSIGSILIASIGSDRTGHGTRITNDILVAFQLAAAAYYLRIGLTSELESQQRFWAIAAVSGAVLCFLIAIRMASAKRFLRLLKSGDHVTWRVLRPNIILGIISLAILFLVAPRLPQPQLAVRAPSGKPEHLSVESILPSQDARYDGAPLYPLDHIPHLAKEAASSPQKFVGAFVSEKSPGSGPFKWVLMVRDDFRNFSLSVRAAYLVNDDKPRPFQVLEVAPRGEPPYHEIAVEVLQSYPGDRILVVASLKQVAPGNPMPEDVRKMFEPPKME